MHLHVQLVQVLGAKLKQLLGVLGELVDILWHLNHHHNDDIILMTGHLVIVDQGANNIDGFCSFSCLCTALCEEKDVK